MFIEPHELETVKGILKTHVPECEIWAFGSRVHKENLKPFSDLDLAVITEEQAGFAQYAALKTAFSESDLPFKVDVVDWATAGQSLREIIKQKYEIIQKPDGC